MRDDAALLIVFVSDEEEQSQEYFTSDPAGLSDFINWYGFLRQSVYMASIVNVHEDQNECGHAVNSVDIGHRYMEATDHFNGITVDICAQDWAPGVAAASEQVEPFEEWPLTHTPMFDSIRVFENGMLADSVDRIYNSATNSVEFLVIPAEGSLVEIGYIIDPDYEGDDDDSAE